MELKNKIKELKPYDLNCNVFDVYSYNGLTMQELLCQFFTKINECIGVSNNTLELADWLVNEGLKKEVVEKLLLWISDGTLEQLINVTLFENLNNKLDNVDSQLNNKLDNVDSQLGHINKQVDYITPEIFGAKGDGVSDDSKSLQEAIDHCRTNNKTLMLFDKLYYITKPLKIGNVKIRSFSNTPGECDVLYLKKKNGEYLYGSPDWTYYFNTNSSLTWRDVIDNCAYGCAIISDKDINILTIRQHEKIDIEGIAVIGNHRQKNQNGICDEVPTRYYYNEHHIKNVNVIGCGKNGINLYRGFECSTIENLNSSCNNGYGLFVGQYDGIDCATEYLMFNNCYFTHNRFSGVYLSYWRKHITFNNCCLNGNGQYYQDVKIDPILGYDRSIPKNLKDIHAGIWFNKGNVEVDNVCLNLTIRHCFGEDLLKGVHIQNDIGNGVLNNVVIENNIFYRGTINSEIGTCFFINVNYLDNCTIKGTFGSGLEKVVFGKDYNDGGQNQILDFVNNEYKDIYYQNGLVSERDITSKKRVYSNNLLFNSVGGFSDITAEFNHIKNDFKARPYSNESVATGVYVLSATWQGDNADTFSSYLLLVTRVPSGNYKMLVIASDDTEGFRGQPRITNDGTLQVDVKEYFRYTLVRVDSLNTL